MMDRLIRKKIEEGEREVSDLLYLANPSREAVNDYIRRGECYGVFEGEELVGEYVLSPLRSFTVELKTARKSE